MSNQNRLEAIHSTISVIVNQSEFDNLNQFLKLLSLEEKINLWKQDDYHIVRSIKYRDKCLEHYQKLFPFFPNKESIIDAIKNTIACHQDVCDYFLGYLSLTLRT